jgi:hypothetical protein
MASADRIYLRFCAQAVTIVTFSDAVCPPDDVEPDSKIRSTKPVEEGLAVRILVHWQRVMVLCAPHGGNLIR